jgi:hypothetical protein
MARRFSISEIACFPPKRGSQSAHGVNWQREVLTTLEEFCLGKRYRHHHRCAFVLDRRRMLLVAD